MTASSRPNLGGLFNGSQPPARPGRAGGTAGPKLVVTAPEPVAAETEPAPKPAPSGSLPEWADPVRAVEQYFAVLRALLEVNRDIAVACTRAVLTLPRRVGIRR